jgi:hypothetical protein
MGCRAWLIILALSTTSGLFLLSARAHAEDDYSWLNGTNHQPDSLLVWGPVTGSIYVDAYYLYQFNNPIDHTAFPSSTAVRDNEISINLASIGIDVTGLAKPSGPIGRFYIQYGTNVATIAGQDATTERGYYLTHTSFDSIQQAAAGWHFDSLEGINTEIGIFPSYFALESYLPEENWDYLHPFVSDFTPYYFTGSRNQFFLNKDLKLELWIVNGWQSFGQWHEARAGGYLLSWKTHGDFSLATAFYTGTDQETNPSRRYYSDSAVQWKYAPKLALCSILDLGYAGSGIVGGGSIANRFFFARKWALTLRFDAYYDKSQALVTPLPSGAPLPDSTSPFWGRGYTATLDFNPSPWLLYRLEFMHRDANIPYFSGHGGISGPTGVPPATGTPIPDLVNDDNRLVLNATLRL